MTSQKTFDCPMIAVMGEMVIRPDFFHHGPHTDIDSDFKFAGSNFFETETFGFLPCFGKSVKSGERLFSSLCFFAAQTPDLFKERRDGIRLP